MNAMETRKKEKINKLKAESLKRLTNPLAKLRKKRTKIRLKIRNEKDIITIYRNT